MIDTAKSHKKPHNKKKYCFSPKNILHPRSCYKIYTNNSGDLDLSTFLFSLSPFLQRPCLVVRPLKKNFKKRVFHQLRLGIIFAKATLHAHSRDRENTGFGEVRCSRFPRETGTITTGFYMRRYTCVSCVKCGKCIKIKKENHCSKLR